MIEPSDPAGSAPLPPHAIRADGVGPYKLGASVAELLDQLPSGPRIASSRSPASSIATCCAPRSDAILIGAEPQGKATFVAVVRGDIARTEAGIHVGSTRDELARSLGAPLDDPDRARDPRLVMPTNMKNVRVVFDDDDRIAAFVVTAEREPPRRARRPPASGRARGHRAIATSACSARASRPPASSCERRTTNWSSLARDGEKPITPPAPRPGTGVRGAAAQSDRRPRRPHRDHAYR